MRLLSGERSRISAGASGGGGNRGNGGPTSYTSVCRRLPPVIYRHPRTPRGEGHAPQAGTSRPRPSVHGQSLGTSGKREDVRSTARRSRAATTCLRGMSCTPNKKIVHADEQRRPDDAAARRRGHETQPLSEVRQYIFVDESGVTTELTATAVFDGPIDNDGPRRHASGLSSRSSDRLREQACSNLRRI